MSKSYCVVVVAFELLVLYIQLLSSKEIYVRLLLLWGFHQDRLTWQKREAMTFGREIIEDGFADLSHVARRSHTLLWYRIIALWMSEAQSPLRRKGEQTTSPIATIQPPQIGRISSPDSQRDVFSGATPQPFAPHVLRNPTAICETCWDRPPIQAGELQVSIRRFSFRRTLKKEGTQWKIFKCNKLEEFLLKWSSFVSSCT